MSCICDELLENPDLIITEPKHIYCYSSVIKQCCIHIKACPYDQEITNKVVKIRHNFFGVAFCLDNGISVEKFDQSLSKYTKSETNLTPDIITSTEKGIKVIDFCVTRDSDLAERNKTLKYGKVLSGNDELEIVIYDIIAGKVMMPSCYMEGIYLSIFQKLMEETSEYWRYLTSEESRKCDPLLSSNYWNNCSYCEKEVKFNQGDFLKDYVSSPEFEEDFWEAMDGFRDNWRIYISYDSQTKKLKGGKFFPAGCTTVSGSEKVNMTKREWKQEYYKNRKNLHRKILVSGLTFSNTAGHLDETPDLQTEPGHKLLKIERKESWVFCPSDFDQEKSLKKIIKWGKKMTDDKRLLSSKKIDREMVKTIARDFLKETRVKWSCCSGIRMRQLFMYPVLAPEMAKKYVRGEPLFLPFTANDKTVSLLKRKPLIFEMGQPVPLRIDEDQEKDYMEYRLARIRRSDLKRDMEWKDKQEVDRENEKLNALKSRSEKIKAVEELMVGKRGTVKEYWEATLKSYKLSKSKRWGKVATRRRKNTIKLNSKETRIVLDDMENIIDYQKKTAETVGNYWFNGEEVEFEFLEGKILDLLDYFYADGFGINYDYISSYEYSERDLTEEQKRRAYNKYLAISEEIGSKCFMHVAEFISKFCYSLMSMSLYNTRKGVISYDNMGYSNCTLLVCGQKGRMGRNETKPFKFIIPINKVLEEVVGYGGTRGEIVRESTGDYYISNWRFLKMEQVKYGIELPTRIQQIFCCTMIQYPEIQPDHPSNRFKLLLMLNNRRKNEEFLHDIKYLTYNILGVQGCYEDLLRDKFLPPHDHIMRYIEEKFLRGIPEYVDSAQNSGLYDQKLTGNYNEIKLKHPLAYDLEGMDVFDCWVYSSHCMIKAAFTQEMERHKNLKGIIDVHERAMCVIGPNDDECEVRAKTTVPVNRVFDHELFYNEDSISLCSAVLKNYLMKSGNVNKLSSKWVEICDSDITCYANSSGLRKQGLNDPKNWGQKGHDVLLDFLDNRFESCKEMSAIFDETDLDIDDEKGFKKAKEKLNSTRYTVRMAEKSEPLGAMEFSMADKKQWGGNREIYIMTRNMKNIQWCLEQMFACICRVLPNELISVPSNKRMKIFYESIKEQSTARRYYCVFDCRKWAPLSNLCKYRQFVNGLKGVLPDSFIETFNGFWDKYYDKKLFVKGKDLDFLNFEEGQERLQWFKLEKEGKMSKDGKFIARKIKHGKVLTRKLSIIKPDAIYSIRMNYSFMMGIFNYLSSLLHSSVQMLFCEEIVPRMNDLYNVTVKAKLWAHSDDSGGYFDIYTSHDDSDQNDAMMRRYLSTYEVLQKTCNHMFSLKKCTITHSYFEIISNIMIYGDIVPVTTKFINSHQLNLTTQGPVSDIKSLSSQAIELLANGGSNECSYIKLVCLNNLYFRFFYGSKPLPLHQKLPVECGGVLDENPALMLMFSSSAQISRLKRENLSRLCSQFTELSLLLGKESSNFCLPSPNFFFRYKSESSSRVHKVLDLGVDCEHEDIAKCLPNNNFIFYITRMKNLFKKQAIEYSMDNVRGLEIMESYLDSRFCPLIMMQGAYCTTRQFGSIVAKAMIFSDRPKFEEGVLETIDYSTIVSDEFFRILDNHDSELRALPLSHSLRRMKPLEFHMSNLLITNNSVYNNKNVVRFVINKKICIMDCDFRTYLNLVNAKLDLIEVKTAIMLVESGKMLEDFYMISPAKLPNGINSYNEFIQFLMESNESNCFPNEQVVYSLLNGITHVNHYDKLNAECVSRAYCLARIKDQKSEIRIKDGAYQTIEKWLLRHSQEINETKQSLMMIGNVNPEDMVKQTNWITYITGNQAKLDPSWWRGNTTAYCSIRGRFYVLKITNHIIEHVVCDMKIQKLETIKSDMEELRGFSLTFRMKRGPKKIFSSSYGSKFGGCYLLDNGNNSIDYLQNIQPTVFDMSHISFELSGPNLYLIEDGKKHRCYFPTLEPCKACLEKIEIVIKGQPMPLISKLESGQKLICNRTKEALLTRFETTHLFKKIREKMIKRDPEERTIPKMNQHYPTQAGTLLGEIIEDQDPEEEEGKEDEWDYKKMKVRFRKVGDQNLTKVISEITDMHISFNWRMEPFIPKSQIGELRKKIDESGLQNTCRALVKREVKRGPMYYSQFSTRGAKSANYEIFPKYIEDMIRYWGEPFKGENSETNQWLASVLLEMGRTIYCHGASMERWGTTTIEESHNPVLLLMLKRKRDEGEKPCENKEFFYDPERIYICFTQYLFLNFLWMGQKSNAKVKSKAFMKKAGSILEEVTGFIGWQVEEAIIDAEIRSLERVYGFDYDEGMYPPRTNDLANVDLEEEGVSIEECPVVNTAGKLGTTVYGSYLRKRGEYVRGYICSADEQPLCLVDMENHTYIIDPEEEMDNDVSQILGAVKEKVIGPMGEIVNKWSMANKRELDIRTLLGVNEQMPIDYMQASYLYCDPAIRNAIGRKLEKEGKKPNQILLYFEQRAVKSVCEQVLLEVGKNSPQDAMKIVLGNEKFEMITSRTFGVSDATIDMAVQSELEKIDPRILPMSLRGGLCLTPRNKQLLEIACKNIDWKVIGKKNEIFLRLLMNECNITEQKTRDTIQTNEIIEGIICSIDDVMKKKRNPETNDYEFWMDESETVSAFSYSI